MKRFYTLLVIIWLHNFLFANGIVHSSGKLLEISLETSELCLKTKKIEVSLTFKLYDNHGKLVMLEQFSNTTYFKLNHYPSGIYHFVAYDKSGNQDTGSFQLPFITAANNQG